MFEKHLTSVDFITIGKSGLVLFPARPFCVRFYGNGKNEVGYGTKSHLKDELLSRWPTLFETLFPISERR